MSQGVLSHQVMLADKVRMDSYKKAILEVVKKDDIVCDVGTGSGILAFFSILAGAKKVYAIERGEIIKEAEQLACKNGFADKIIFIKGSSDKVELPEKVDVITSELIGFFGLEENLHRFLIDARERFLKPEGRLIPSWLELYLAPVESEETWNKTVGFWNKDFYGLDFSCPGKEAASRGFLVDYSNKINGLALPVMISHLNFFEIENLPLVFHAKFAANKKSYFHGLAGYFKAGLSKNIILSNSPSEPRTHWRQAFFPIEEALAVAKSDEIVCVIKALPQSNNLFWQWDTGLYRDGVEIAKFSQSNFHIDKEELIIGRKDFKPILTQEAEIYRRVLNLCDGNRTIEEISEIVFAEYPGKYKDIKDARREVVGTVRGKARIM